MMTFDVADNYVLLFGGGTIPGPSGGWDVHGDTWTFSHGEWTNISGSLARSPAARSDAGLVYDVADGYVVLFGGLGGPGGNTAFNDTWTFLAGTWSQLAPSTSPSARGDISMTYDPADASVILFGGCVPGPCSTAVDGDTWTFHAGNWTLVPPSGTQPPARGSASLTYDAKDGYVLLFGGRNGGSTRFNDTWSYLAGVWTPIATGIAPSGRLWAGLTYDPALGHVLLYGGDAFGAFDNETWEYSAGAWTDLTGSLTANPGPLAQEGLVYDGPANATLLFGGQTFFPVTLSATWYLGNQTATRFVISLTTVPSSCPAIEVELGSQVAGGSSIVLSPGAYTAIARPCGGYTFEQWTGGGNVSLNVTSESTPIDYFTVNGSGSLLATYITGIPLYSVVLAALPATCGMIGVGVGGQVELGGTLSLAAGTYLATAPSCPGYNFGSWGSNGSVVINPKTANMTGVEFVVDGPGGLTASYSAIHANSTSAPLLTSGTIVGLAAGAALGVVVGVGAMALLRRRPSTPPPPAH